MRTFLYIFVEWKIIREIQQVKNCICDVHKVRNTLINCVDIFRRLSSRVDGKRISCYLRLLRCADVKIDNLPFKEWNWSSNRELNTFVSQIVISIDISILFFNVLFLAAGKGFKILVSVEAIKVDIFFKSISFVEPDGKCWHKFTLMCQPMFKFAMFYPCPVCGKKTDEERRVYCNLTEFPLLKPFYQ